MAVSLQRNFEGTWLMNSLKLFISFVKALFKSDKMQSLYCAQNSLILNKYISFWTDIILSFLAHIMTIICLFLFYFLLISIPYFICNNEIKSGTKTIVKLIFKLLVFCFYVDSLKKYCDYSGFTREWLKIYPWKTFT